MPYAYILFCLRNWADMIHDIYQLIEFELNTKTYADVTESCE